MCFIADSRKDGITFEEGRKTDMPPPTSGLVREGLPLGSLATSDVSLQLGDKPKPGGNSGLLRLLPLGRSPKSLLSLFTPYPIVALVTTLCIHHSQSPKMGTVNVKFLWFVLER